VDDIKTLSIEDLRTLRAAKRTEFDALVKNEAPSQEQVEQAIALGDEVDGIDAEFARRKEQADRFSSLKDKTFAGDESEVEVEPEVEPEKGEEKEEVEVKVETEETPAETPAEVAAKSGVATLAAKTKRPETAKEAPKVILKAAANVDGFSTGQTMLDLTDIARGVIAKAKGFSPPTGDGQSENLQKFGTAMIQVPFPEDLIIDRMDDAQAVLQHAADETRLDGNSLTASGGWCAPSETIYDLSQDATTEGMLSLPEVAVRRGGIRYAQSPTFADFYANPGFIQTEAQAIAGTAKTCVEVDCPDFTEVRLDAAGICIKVPILTNAGYPEVVRNFIDGTLVAHQHWINANVIGRLVTAAGAARVIAGLGSTTLDTLGGLELLAEERRQMYRLSLGRTLEVVVPFWVRAAIRADLAARTGLDNASAVTDANIKSYFKARNLNVQFVYDWQNLDTTAEVYPATFNALMYPAGTFVKGTADVINLSPVYDAASLAVNIYTGLFSEQGLLVAKMKFDADLVTLPVCNAGRTGAADLTCETTP
jgi:hypothetical protein